MRERIINILISSDIDFIKRELAAKETDFIHAVLSGNGWKQYSLLSDNEIEREFNDRKEELLDCEYITEEECREIEEFFKRIIDDEDLTVSYRGVVIELEREEEDEDGNTISFGLRYSNSMDWHEFEGSGLFMTMEDAIEYAKEIIIRDKIGEV